jgi:SAM-dependent methyltransferase
MAARQPIPSSYRDPAGFVIADEGIYKRVITTRGVNDFDFYLQSGLHTELVREGLVLDFEEETVPAEEHWKRLLIPEQLRFVSYSYEWSFDQLKDAALLTLAIQQKALRRGLSLKDSSAYNVQFRGSKPVFIDTLSFERNRGGPWIAYEQFCRQFLGPLALMSYGNPDAARYLKADLDGFPLDQVSRSLPKRSYLRAGPLLHIHLHARALRKQSETPQPEARLSNGFAVSLVDSLVNAVERLRPPSYAKTWTDYYPQSRFYPGNAIDAKRKAVHVLTAGLRPSLVFDLGANTGVFARDITLSGVSSIAFDSDPGCINHLYLEERTRPDSRILPLVMDMANPSPPLGFGLKGTLSLFDRPQADLVLCLALVHHLRFTGNLPLRNIADFLARLGRRLLIEFVPGEDPATSALLHGRDRFDDYTPTGFEDAFRRHYHLRAQHAIAGSERTLFLFERHS